MTATGIICEYNPFHFGHMYHISKIREKYPNDVIVCCMSGNFVQRGDYALFPKSIRATAAVSCGADLVVELPAPWAVSSAPRFAAAGVFILSALGCSRLSFGSECGDYEKLLSCASLLETEQFDISLKDALSLGLSFPSAQEKAAKENGFSDSAILSSSNDILALSYIQAVRNQCPTMEIFPVLRTGALHDSPEPDEDIPSASFLRSKFSEVPHTVPSGIPPLAQEVFSKAIQEGFGPIYMETMDTSFMSTLRRLSMDQLALLPDMKEGFESRLFRAISESSSIDEVIRRAKTKRYTYSRIRRQLLCSYLGLFAKDQEKSPPYTQILAFNEQGRRYLSIIKDTSVLVINKPARHGMSGAAKLLFEKTLIWDDLYMLACPGIQNRVSGSSMRTTPVYIRENIEKKEQ